MRKDLHHIVLRNHIFFPKSMLIVLLLVLLSAAGTARSPSASLSYKDSHAEAHPGQLPGFEIDAMSTVGAGAELIEQYLAHALSSLRLIATSPTTRSGIWPEIRPLMQTLCQTIPGAALYIQPDGGYYSVEHGYTGLTLADRDYFEPLFSGREIHGSLIQSRSTGKKSVLMAVPVFEQDEVTGAVALSVFLDDFQKMISDALDLPPGYLWYAINEEGNTVLHPRPDFVFMNPAEQGSPSMVNAVATMTAQRKGYTSYVFAGRNTHILFKKVPFNNWRMVLGKVGEQVADDYMPQAYEILDNLKAAIGSKLRDMDESLDAAVNGFGGRLPAEHIARNAFRNLYENNPYVISCALIDPDGHIVYAEPSDFHASEGENIRDQENFFVMQKNKAPMLSNSFLAIEGFDAVSLQHPIIDDVGNFLGSVSLMIRPELMVEEIVAPHIAETTYEPWIMEPDGRIIFDRSFDGTGRMLFLDYRYEEMQNLLDLGEKIVTHNSGQGDYIFFDENDQERVVKMALWDTIKLHNTQWRLVISYTPYD